MKKRKKLIVWMLLMGILLSLLPNIGVNAETDPSEEDIYSAAPSTEVYAAGTSSNGNHEYRSNDFPYPLYCVSPTRWGPHHADSTVTYYCNAWSDAGFAFPYTVDVDGVTVDIRNVVYYYEKNQDGLNFGIGGPYYQQAHFDLAYFLNMIGKNEAEDAYNYAAWNAEARGGVAGGVEEITIRNRLKDYNARGAALIRESTEAGVIPVITMYVMKTDGSYVNGNGQAERYQDLITYQFDYSYYSDVYLTLKKESLDKEYAPSLGDIEYQMTDTYGKAFLTFTLNQYGYTKNIVKNTGWTNANYEFVGQELRQVDGRTVAVAHIRRKTSNAGLPANAFLLRESKTNENYAIRTGSTSVPAVKHGDLQLLTVETNQNLGDVPVYPVRGNISLEKIRLSDGKPLEGVKFEVKNKTTGESHILYTDAEGKATTEVAAYTANVNLNDRKADYDGTKNEIWFSKDQDGKSWNPMKDLNGKQLGALPVGTYVITEKACAANKGCQLLRPITVEIISEKTVNVQERDGRIYNAEYPMIGTKASVVTSEGESKILPASEGQTIRDVVSYENLRVNTTFTLIGTLMIKEDDGTVEPFLNEEGKPVRARKVFSTKAEYAKSEFEAAGEVEVLFEELKLLCGHQGKSFVVFERLYLGDVTEEDVAAGNYPAAYPEGCDFTFPLCHEDQDDAGQTVVTPDIRTSAKGKEGEKLLENTAKGFVDTVSFTNLRPNNSYKLYGEAYDPETGEVFLVNGSPLTAEAEFVTGEANNPAGGTDGCCDVLFHFPENAEEELAGKKLVVFETLYDGDGTVMAGHRELSDEEQTVSFKELEPKVSSGEPEEPPKPEKPKEEPKKPEEPTRPEEPKTPATPKTPETKTTVSLTEKEPEKVVKKEAAPKTGDRIPFENVVLAIIVSGLGILLILAFRRFDSDDQNS